MKMPTEKQLLKMIAGVAKDYDVPPPKVRFAPTANACTEFKTGTLVLHSHEWIKEYARPQWRAVYAVHVMLHEMAHWIMGQNEGHTPAFYALLFEMDRRYGVPLAQAVADEHHYKPRASTKGLDLYLAGLVA